MCQCWQKPSTQPNLRLWEVDYANERTHRFRDRAGRLIGAEPEMNALKEIPRRNDVSDAASVLGACPHSRQRFRGAVLPLCDPCQPGANDA
jgi:hypothetical protein